MIQMTNIAKEANVIRCNYSPEESQDLGIVAVNLTSEDFVELKKTIFDEDTERYAAKVKFRLLDLAKEEKIPTASRVVWG